MLSISAQRGLQVVFSSPSFIFVFLPLFFASYYLVPPQSRNLVILLGSILFYFVGANNVVLVLILSVPINQYIARYIYLNSGTRRAQVALTVGIMANLAPLLIYKYLGFIALNLDDGLSLFGLGRPIPVPELLLPAGISFFTFQGLSYIADVHSRLIKPAPTLIDFGMYHTSFPN